MHIWVLARNMNGVLGASCMVGTCSERLSVKKIEAILDTYKGLVEALTRIANFFVLKDGSMGGGAVDIAKEALAKAEEVES